MSLLYFLYVFIFFWLIHITQRIFYSAYFLQLKEYRFDRIKGEIKTSLRAFFPKISSIALVLLVLYPFTQFIFWNDIVFIVFCLFGAYSLLQLVKMGWKMPKFTKKVILLLILTISAVAYCFFIFTNKIFLFVVILEIILPLVVLLIVEILQIPTFLIKSFIYAKAKRKISKQKNLTVIAVTGSYGKSSTKEFLYAFLSKKYNVLKTIGNNNTEISISQAIIKNLKPEHQIFIVEMAAYRKGEIKLLCDITKPKIGIVTGVNEQHSALFGSFDNLLSAEGGGELADALPKDGILVVNGDNKYCLDLYKNRPEGYPRNKRMYSLSNKTIDADIWADSISIYKNSVSFVAINKSKEMMHFDVNVLGKQNVQNILGAILISRRLGVSFEEISQACKDITQETVGMTLLHGKYDIDIIDSSYSSNPDGVFADLNYLSLFEGKKVIVMPCLIELGKKSPEIHEKIGREIGKICDLAIITNKDKFAEIKKGAAESGMLEKDIILCDNSKDIYSMITVFCKSGDTVLLEGRVPAKLIDLLK